MLELSAGKTSYLDQVVANIALDTMAKLELVLQQVGQETIDYLRSLTDEMRPPARAGEPQRQAHPGHWADVTSQLANSYRWEVQRTGDSLRLRLANDAEHAVYLEQRDGFFVLSGVTEPGGPVETALRAVVARLAPEMTVVLGASGGF
ncbi:MAG TPA: hypothetical protein VEB59_02450 [Gemmatimonadales bacterium]|nr:hypothetical protein [Gemmatimonadales bacterium]